jgi:hypothetical protein
VVNQLSIILQGYGLKLDALGGKQVLQNVDESQLIEMMNTQEVNDPQVRSNCLQVLMDSNELINTLNSKIQLLDNIENYLQDWLWGLTYQSIRRGEEEGNDQQQDDLM